MQTALLPNRASNERIVPNTTNTKTWTATNVPNTIKKMNATEKQEERSDRYTWQTRDGGYL